MAHTICRCSDYYYEWSSVVDAPISYRLTQEDAYALLACQPERLVRLKAFGTTARSGGKYRPEAESFNRAGPNEEWLTPDGINAMYADEQSEREFREGKRDITPFVVPRDDKPSPDAPARPEPRA